MSQTDEVTWHLCQGWTCGTVLLDQRIPRYAARIHEARRRGYRVERRCCESHQHVSQQFEWRIVGWRRP
jgi:hypothetical protein